MLLLAGADATLLPGTELEPEHPEERDAEEKRVEFVGAEVEHAAFLAQLAGDCQGLWMLDNYRPMPYIWFMARRGTCTRCSATGYMMARLETDVVAEDLLEMEASTCIVCTVILWDWLQERVTPRWILGAARDVHGADRGVPHDLVKGTKRLHIWSDANQASRKWHSWFLSSDDAERVLDFLTST